MNFHPLYMKDRPERPYVTTEEVFPTEDEGRRMNREEGAWDGFRVYTSIDIGKCQQLAVSSFGDWHCRFKRQPIGVNRWYETAVIVESQTAWGPSKVIEVMDGVFTDDLTGTKEGDDAKALAVHRKHVARLVAEINTQLDHGVDTQCILSAIKRRYE